MSTYSLSSMKHSHLEEDASVISSTYTSTSSDRDKDSVPLMIGHKENRWVSTSRLIVLAVLALCASVTGYLTHKFTKDQNQQKFESEFIGIAHQIAKIMAEAEKDIGTGLEAFARSITATKLTVDERWPQYLVPNLEYRGGSARRAAGVHFIDIVVQVEADEIESYNEYAANHGEWYNESLAMTGLKHPANLHQPNTYLAAMNFQDFLNSTVPQTGEGPYYTIVQSSPPRTLSSFLYNVAFLPTMGFGHRYRFMNATGKTARSTILSPKDPFLADVGSKDPLALYYQPLYQDEAQQTFSAFLYGTYSWNDTLGSILDEEDGAVYVVIETKSCNRTVTYFVDGPNATYIGDDPFLHDTKYEPYVVEAGLSATLEEIEQYGSDETSLSCHYSMRVYPTDEFQAKYENKEPLHYMLVVLGIFAFTTFVFIGYDWMVQLRQDKVMDTAVKTDAIVNSMFPEQFRDQLFENNTKKAVGAKSYLGDFASGKFEEDQRDRPVADLFTQATIMFADIAGFTAWSSSRDAIQVFQLLEAIYGTFDDIAKKRRVYKVETVGDSYVAVCGVPVQRKDHAVNMVRFARDCLKALAPTVMNLERSLGPGTGDLRMRFGLHSGPVTAGVLRGERARFQLFGTTVNTASRIESTGKPNRIHLSEQTAELLIAAGKSDWVVRREDKVEAKGLGQLTTYWAVLKTASMVEHSPHDADTQLCLSESLPSDEYDIWANTAVPDTFTEQGLSENTQRLVLWNVELLTGLLEQIVVGRKEAKASDKNWAKSSSKLSAEASTRSFEGDKIVIDEVAEIIKLPDFDATKTKRKQESHPGDKSSQLSQKVKDQLYQLVTAVAMGYRNNPFHNFEHASHVAMSVQKLLSRIIAPEIDVSGPEDTVALALHDHTYGITSDPLTQFAVVLSALIHDVDHRGVPNGQLAKEDSAMAAVYRNQSIAEQNSVDIAWSLFEQDDLDDLRDCIYTNKEERARFRQILVNCVMATDIFDKQMTALRKARWNAAFAENADSVEKDVNVDRNRKATIVIEHLIQASDVAHTMQHWHVYRKWNEKLFVEMFLAFKSGRSEKSPADGWYKGELWFFDNYIIPLAKKLDNCGVFGVSSDEYLSYAVSNRKEWETKGQGVVAEMLEKLGHA